MLRLLFYDFCGLKERGSLFLCFQLVGQSFGLLKVSFIWHAVEILLELCMFLLFHLFCFHLRSLNWFEIFGFKKRNTAGQPFLELFGDYLIVAGPRCEVSPSSFVVLKFIYHFRSGEHMSVAKVIEVSLILKRRGFPTIFLGLKNVLYIFKSEVQPEKSCFCWYKGYFVFCSFSLETFFWRELLNLVDNVLSRLGNLLSVFKGFYELLV